MTTKCIFHDVGRQAGVIASFNTTLECDVDIVGLDPLSSPPGPGTCHIDHDALPADVPLPKKVVCANSNYVY